jgi:hypothetical protein
LLNSGTLYEHQGFNYSVGWYNLGSGIRDISASQLESDCVYTIDIFNNLHKHLGTSSASQYNFFLDGNVVEVSAGRDPYGNAAAFARYTSGSVEEIWGLDTIHTHFYLGSGVNSISASQVESDCVYMILSGNNLYKHLGTTPSGYHYLGTNVVEVSAGRDPYGNAAAFARYASGLVQEIWGLDASLYHFNLGSGFIAVSASQIQADTVYMTDTYNFCYEHIGTSSSSGFYNVAWDF